VADAAGNVLNMNTAALASAGFQTTLTVTTGSDTTPPSLGAFSFSPTSINVAASSANVPVSFQVTDDLSGVTTFQAAFVSPSGEGIQAATANFAASLAFNGTAIVTFPKNSESGIWTVADVYLVDAAGNARLLATSDLIARGFQTQLTVSSTTQPPVAAAQAQSLSYPGPAAFTLDASDPSGATLTYHQTSNPTKGAVTVNCTTSCAATYTPNFGAGGLDSFSYYVTNPSNLASSTVTVTITISAVEVTSSLQATISGLGLHRGTGIASGTVTLKNNGAAAISAPLQAVFTALPSNVVLVNATGTVPSGDAYPDAGGRRFGGALHRLGPGPSGDPYAGSPYITVPGSTPLAVGASVTIAVQFKVSSGPGVSYVLEILSGGF
jgi:hypothetical protein